MNKPNDYKIDFYSASMKFIRNENVELKILEKVRSLPLNFIMAGIKLYFVSYQANWESL